MFEEIKEIFSEQLGVESEIKLESKLKEELGVDSLLAVELSILLENKYNTTIKDEELAKLVTIKDVIDLLESKGATTKCN